MRQLHRPLSKGLIGHTRIGERQRPSILGGHFLHEKSLDLFQPGTLVTVDLIMITFDWDERLRSNKRKSAGVVAVVAPREAKG
jgi:hypothetical protein